MTGTSVTPQSTHHPLLRRRDGHHTRVGFEELFFDLVYVFAVTQVAHALLHHLTAFGVLEALILWFAVWLGWQYTCWVTNWFDPHTTPIRALLFATMLLGLIMAASIPQAFGERGWVFAGAYLAMQVGRTAFIVCLLPKTHPLAPNFRRILGWVSISAIFWTAGAFADGHTRAYWWIAAIACEYLSPTFGFALPGLGRSRTSDWTIEGGHLAERCQLFVIVALGETVLATGASLARTELWDSTALAAMAVTFVGTLAMWWLYFGTSSQEATDAITSASDPGRMGANFHYVHAILIAGIVVTAVGHDLVLAQPLALPDNAERAALLFGPAIYLAGSAIYQRVVRATVPWPQVAALLALVAMVALTPPLPKLALAALGVASILSACVLDKKVQSGKIAHGQA